MYSSSQYSNMHKAIQFWILGLGVINLWILSLGIINYEQVCQTNAAAYCIKRQNECNFNWIAYITFLNAEVEDAGWVRSVKRRWPVERGWKNQTVVEVIVYSPTV